jgi:hypothetical protein
MANNITLAIKWHVQDNWYGKNYRMILNGFKNKTEARKQASMFKKFVCKTQELKSKDISVEIDKLENLETFVYASNGPSWSCSNHEVNYDKFLEFVVEEKERLKINKERRDRDTRNRKQRGNMSSINKKNVKS